jgi:hypothetical protein
MICYRLSVQFDPKNSLHLPLCFVISQAASSIQRTACTCLVFYNRSSSEFDPKNNLYLPICLCFRSSSKFDPKNSLYLPICLCFRSSDEFDPKNSLYPSFVCILGQVTSSIQRTTCTYLFVARSIYLDVCQSPVIRHIW